MAKNKMIWLGKPLIESHQSALELSKRAVLQAAIHAEVIAPLIPGQPLSGAEKLRIRERLVGHQRWRPLGEGVPRRSHG